MKFGLRFRLSTMMFLQYAIWGAWAPVLSGYLVDDLGFTKFQAGFIYSLLPLATMISPFIFGQLADRLVATQRLLSMAHIGGGIALLVAASQTSYSGISWLMLIYALLYGPTLALSNSICFNHMRDSEKEFGGIRMWGTIGWMASGWLLTAWRSSAGLTGMSDSLLLAGAFALMLGIFSLALPHTPPKKEGANPLAFMDALKLLKNRNFAIFMIISFVVATELQFYYILTAPFLLDIGIAGQRLPAIMTIAQGAEALVMVLLLPILLPKLGARKMLAIGVIAWPIRYAIFAIGAPTWLVVSSLALHGFCYVFFFVVGFIYVDQVAKADIRASAQSLVAFVILGLGAYVGSLFSGWIGDAFKLADGSADWRMIFIVPLALTITAAIAFLVAFKDEKAEAPQMEEAVTAEA